MLVTPVSVSVYVFRMSNRSKRRIDYSLWHKHGIKVDKNMDDKNQGPVLVGDKQVQELKIREDLKFSICVYL